MKPDGTLLSGHGGKSYVGREVLKGYRVTVTGPLNLITDCNTCVVID